MDTFIVFIILSIPVTFISLKSFLKIRSHGFFRYLSWECILWLFACNYRYWFVKPFCITQLIAWLLLMLGAIVVILGVIKLRKEGNANNSRKDKNLYTFEKTTNLITSGIFNYIRHPLYASLVYLSWGIFFKHATNQLLIISFLSSIFIYITARYDEKECLEFFGEEYRHYMKKSKMFIPFIF